MESIVAQPIRRIKKLLALRRHRAVIISNSNSSKVICSGYLINKEWVLTAGHCLEGINRPLEGIRVTSLANENFHQTKAIKDFWPRVDEFTAFGASHNGEIDYVLLRLDEFVDDDQLEDDQCINTSHLNFQERIFVTGFPKDHVTTEPAVKAPGNVWFPHEIKSSDIGGILSHALQAELDFSWKKKFSDTERLKRLPKVHEELCKAYKQNGYFRHFYYSNSVLTKERPRFGTDTDTTQRNSGSPVFGGDICLRGVFAGGEDDRLTGLEPNFTYHEYATPIGNILDHLSQRKFDAHTNNLAEAEKTDIIEGRKFIAFLLKDVADKSKGVTPP